MGGVLIRGEDYLFIVHKQYYYMYLVYSYVFSILVFDIISVVVCL